MVEQKYAMRGSTFCADENWKAAPISVASAMKFVEYAGK
jgi:hypothetical protein